MYDALEAESGNRIDFNGKLPNTTVHDVKCLYILQYER
jgi:hypothetical protein